MRHALRGLAAAALAAALLAWPAGSVDANGVTGTFENHPDVRVFTPTPLARDAEVAEPTPAPALPVKVNVTVYVDALALDRDYRRALAFEYRKDRIRRSLGHLYTGFIKMYRGPRYPF